MRPKNGLIYEYGNSTDSKITLGGSTAREWALSSIRDRAGNRIDFTYEQDFANGSYRPNTINYATNLGLIASAPYQVFFYYGPTNRPDPIYRNYEGGGPENILSRLLQIEIRHNGSPVKIYDLEYQALSGPVTYSRLRYIKECSTSTSDCLSRTEIGWTDPIAGLQAEPLFSQAAPTQPHLIDIDGDGLRDLVYSSHATSGSGTWRIRKGNVSGGFDAESNTGISNTGYSNALPLDWEGDGRTDLLVPFASNQWHVMVSNGSTFAAPWNTGITAALGYHNTLDADGDGRDDLVRLSSSGAATVWVRYRGASNFSAETQLWTSGTANISFWNWWGPVDNRYRTRHGRADFNGDGREDFIGWLSEFDPESGLTASYTARMYNGVPAAFDIGPDLGGNHLYADLNEDGLTDIVWMEVVGTIQIVHGGSGQVVSGPGTPNLQTQTYALADYDGDGHEDIVGINGSTLQLQFFRNNGASFDASVSTGLTYPGFASLRPADLNGDHADDIVSWSSSAIKYRLHQPTPRPNLLASVTDGFDVAATLTYAPMTDSTVYTKGTSAIYPDMDVEDARPLVKVLTRTDGSGNNSTYTLTYTYEGGRVNQHGRGFVGFTKRNVVDDSAGVMNTLRTEETYRQDWPYLGLPAQIILKSGATTIRNTSNLWSALTGGTGFAQRKHPYVYSSTRQEWELNSAWIRKIEYTLPGALGVSGIDATSGLVTDSTTKTTEKATGLYVDQYKTERVFHTVFNDTSADWCIGRPDRTEVTNSLSIAGILPQTRILDRVWNGANCRLTSQVVEPDVSQWTVTTAYGYDGFGNVSSETVTGASMSARTTLMSWGSEGVFPVSVTNPLSQTSTQGFDYALGVQTSFRDPNGATKTWTWAHDAFGRRTLETRPDGTKTATELFLCPTCDARVRYRLQEQVKRPDNALIVTNNLYFDRYDRLLYHYGQEPGGASVVNTVSFDARGRVVSRKNPIWAGGANDGNWAFDYDVLNRVTAERLKDGSGAQNRLQTHAYNGLTLTTTDFKSNASSRILTAWGDLAQSNDAASGQTKYKHDVFGQLLEVKDHFNSVITSIGYNIRGMKTSSADMDMGSWTYVPNALGEVTSQTDAKSQTTTFIYDLLGRMKDRIEAEGTTTWTWGTSAGSWNIGELASVSSPGYAESFTYDNKSRLTQRNITTDTSYQINYAYHAQTGFLDTMTYPLSTSAVRFQLKYDYAYGKLTTVKRNDAGAPATQYWTLTSVDPRGNVMDETLGNGMQVVSTYNPLTGTLEARTSGWSGSWTIQNLQYDWDNNWNLTERRDLRQSVTESFLYDALDRVTRATNGANIVNFDYDAIGNITRKSDVHAGTNSYLYHATQKHALTAVGSPATQTFAYDLNGNMTARNGSVVQWTSYNLPKEINGSGVSSFLSYGPDRQRFKQIGNYVGGQETTHYVGGILQKVVAPTRTHFKHLIAAPGGVVAIYNRRDDATEDTIYFTKDHLGSIDSITNQAQAVQVRLSYDTFGKRRNEAGWWGAVPAGDLTAISNTTRLGYTGHEHLDNLGLIHMNGRVQDPFIGRFLSADPFVPDPLNGQSFNRFSYVRNNPLALIDPSGFTEEPSEQCVFCVYQSTSSIFAPGMFGSLYGTGALSFVGSQYMVAEHGNRAAGVRFVRDRPEPGKALDPTVLSAG